MFWELLPTPRVPGSGSSQAPRVPPCVCLGLAAVRPWLVVAQLQNGWLALTLLPPRCR